MARPSRAKIPVPIFKPRGIYRVYIPRKFNNQSRTLIDRANRIIGRNAEEGYDLTLRQLYYRMVAANIIPNTPKSYDVLGNLITAARRAGEVPWNALVDRTRNLRTLGTFETPGDVIQAAADSWRTDKWADQPNRIEVWVEKDALAGVVARACEALEVPWFSCRGYTSDSEMWYAAQRLRRYYTEHGQNPVVLHLGDHDPSGKDMTRDITDRLEMFSGGIPIERLALNMDQIEAFQPPPNPAKITDSRYEKYAAEFGDESWELDALEPREIGRIITEAIMNYRDEDAWEDALTRQEEEREPIQAAADSWDRVGAFLSFSEDWQDRMMALPFKTVPAEYQEYAI